MKKIILVFGTRPEAIKMCPVILELKKHKEYKTIVCLTGQHKEMLSQVMERFEIVEDYNLGVMSENQTLVQITSKVSTLFDDILEREKPDMVLVHGDTTTSFAAALTTFYRQIPVGHVEAGLRTYNMQSPFPEEFNRQAVDLVSSLFFAPTENAKLKLIAEGKKDSQIFVTGNTVIDALKTTVQNDYESELLDWVGQNKLVLLTAHRRENLGDPMREIFRAINRIVEENRNIRVIYPVHLNPKVQEIAQDIFKDNENVKLINPLDVLDFHNLMKRSYLIMTDSGGIQEEAPAMGIPVLVLRNTTERPEGVEAGTLRLVGTKEEDIYNMTSAVLHDERLYQKMRCATNPYGDGYASLRIVQALDFFFEK